MTDKSQKSNTGLILINNFFRLETVQLALGKGRSAMFLLLLTHPKRLSVNKFVSLCHVFPNPKNWELPIRGGEHEAVVVCPSSVSTFEIKRRPIV